MTAFEASRVLFRLGCDVRVYDPTGLPVKDDVQHQHPKVQELRDLSRWSDGHVWVSPEQHGNLVRQGPLLNRFLDSAFRFVSYFAYQPPKTERLAPVFCGCQFEMN